MRENPQVTAEGVHVAEIEAAVGGDRDALERLVRSVEPLVGRLALRFFGCPERAADATQEVLVQVVTHLGGFERRSSFTTWVYRVATNKFLSLSRSRAEKASLSFEEFERDLGSGAGAASRGASGAPWHAVQPDPDRALLEAEVRIGCTLAMLLCLEREGRMAYILGAILELDHRAAAEILGVAPGTYRKRLERARLAITGLMRRRCGVFDPANACRCSSRVPTAIARQRLDPTHLVFAGTREQVRRFPQVLTEIARLEDLQRATAIYQSHPDPESLRRFTERWNVVLDARLDPAAPPTQG
jgi:RNA polymerase sigma factor (sigma-70 family)